MPSCLTWRQPCHHDSPCSITIVAAGRAFLAQAAEAPVEAVAATRLQPSCSDAGAAARTLADEAAVMGRTRMKEDMNDVTGFKNFSPTTLADVLEREQVMDIGIRPLWPAIRRVARPGVHRAMPSR
jgi:hypothetical protein